MVDETMDIMNGMITQMPQLGDGMTEEELKSQRHTYRDTIVKPALGWIEQRIRSTGQGNTAGTTNTICGIPSVADLFLMTYKTMVDHNEFSHLDSTTVFHDCPHIVDLSNSMMQHPLVVSYNQKKWMYRNKKKKNKIGPYPISKKITK